MERPPKLVSQIVEYVLERQDEVLIELDRLNGRIESLIQELSCSRKSAAAAADFEEQELGLQELGR